VPVDWSLKSPNRGYLKNGQYDYLKSYFPTVTSTPLGVGLNLNTSSVAVSAYNLSVQAISSTANVGNAAATVAANVLSTAGYTASNATVSALASQLTATANLIAVAANVPITAYNLTSVIRALGTSLAVVSSYPLSSSLTLGTASTSVTANNLSASIPASATLQIANVSVAANSLSEALRPSIANVSTTASNLSTGTQLALANISVLANNIASINRSLTVANVTANAFDLLPTRILQLASVSVVAYNLGTTVNNQIVLGSASVLASAYDFDTSGYALALASVSTAARALAVAATQTAANGSVSAFQLSGLRTAALGLASALVTAQGLSSQAPGTAPLQLASVTGVGFALGNYLLASAGLAGILIQAANLAESDQVNSTGTAQAQAFSIQSARNTGHAVAVAVAYALSVLREARVNGANVGVTAYGLSVQVGITKGVITSGRPYAQFKTGGRARAGLSTANPVSSFKKVGG
jgi:hypothetical protein